MGFGMKTDRGGVSFHTVGIEIELVSNGFIPRLQIDGWEDLPAWDKAVKRIGEERAEKLTDQIEDELNARFYRKWLAWDRQGRSRRWWKVDKEWGSVQNLTDLLDHPSFNDFIPDDLEKWYTERLESLLSREIARQSRKGAGR
jgi:hypothetical protein